MNDTWVTFFKTVRSYYECSTRHEIIKGKEVEKFFEQAANA